MHRTVFMFAGLLAALLVGAPAAAADNGLTVLAAPPASNGQMRLQIEVTDPAVQKEIQSAGASPDRFRVAVEQAGAQVRAVDRMADSPKERRYTVLAFDQSKSFSAYWPQAFELAKAWSDELGARSRNHTATVMTFGQGKTTHCEESTAAGLEACLDRVQRLGTDQLVTRLKFYIQQAVREAAREQPLSRRGSREVIVFTDAGEESAALKVKDLAREARERGVRIHMVVFSDGKGTGRGTGGIARRLDEMSQLAEGSGGRYIQVGDVDARQAVTGLVGALEHLYWLDVAFCGVKPGQTSDRLSVEALVGQTPTAWSDMVPFRQRAEGRATAACPGTVVMGASPAQSGTAARPGTPGANTSPGTAPGTPGPGATAGSGSSAQPGTATGSPGTAAQPGGGTGSPGTAAQPGDPAEVPGADAAPGGLPWWLLALIIGLGLLLLLALIVLLARRRSEPAPAPAPKLSPPVAAQPAAPAPAVDPPPSGTELPPAAPAVWKDPFATLPETRLVVSKGPPGLEPFYRVHKSTFTIGARQGEMDLTVNLPQLSGHHATVQLFKAGNVFVKDEHSTNGTFVDGRRLNPGERVQVWPGQSIRLSQHLELTLVQPGLHPATAPSAVPIVPAPPAAPDAPPSAEAPRAKARTLYAPVKGDDE